MGIDWEWGHGGSDLAIVPAAHYENEGIFFDEPDDEPDDGYALVIGGESGGGFIVQDGVDEIAGFAVRVLQRSFAAYRLETAVSRTTLTEWAGRPLTDDDVAKLREWFEQNVGPQVWALVASWDTDTPLTDSPDVKAPVPTPDQLAELSIRWVTTDGTDHKVDPFPAPASHYCRVCGYAGGNAHYTARSTE